MYISEYCFRNWY